MKQLRFTGRAAHAGAFPHLGINALKAAQLALLSVDAQRETFRDEDSVRVHYVMEHAGESVNIVPAEATVELQVRAKTIEALAAAERVVDRCVHGACVAFAADGEVRTVSGYLPHHQDDDLTRLLRANCETLVGTDRVTTGGHVAGCTDMGDLSYLMPVVHPRSAGTVGAAHGSDFEVVDHRLAAVNPAKWMAMTVVDLLTDQADNARSILAKRERPSRAEYLAVRRGLDHVDTFSALAAAGGPGGA
jgi:metal-dependent amidase/aminoacylase/carboxypeptidase family protein